MPDVSMKTEDKTVHNEFVKHPSVGTMTDEEIANARNAAGQPDPLAAFAANGRGVQMSGRADVRFSGHGLAIGDKVYHKVKKFEGTVKDMKASGSIEFEKESGSTFWADPKNLVKL